jgi:Kef-type K+ transport system membrane component KefB
MIQVSIISILLLIIVLHTIFSHVFNWIFRKVSKTEEYFSGVIIFIMIIEALFVVKLFTYYLK